MNRFTLVLLAFALLFSLVSCASAPVTEPVVTPDEQTQETPEKDKLWVCKSATWLDADGSVDTVETFFYDDWGNRVVSEKTSKMMDSAEKPYYISDVSEYDEYGNLLHKSESTLYKEDSSERSSKRVEYVYEDGLLVRENEQELDVEGTSSACYRVYSYDRSGRVIKIEEVQTAPAEYTSQITEYSYSSDFTRELVSKYKNTSSAVPHERILSLYYPTKEKPDRVTVQWTTESTSSTQELLYTYNADGIKLKEERKTEIQSKNGALIGETNWSTEYEVGETLGKVVKETTYYNGELSSTVTYEHDEYGNWKSQDRRDSYGALSRHADYVYEEIEVKPKTEQ
ncbi:MAG: hypothetical protein J6J21_02735 [Clostridia bacterium]|nr:hypothetical protein [Clostridia bacterium]